MHTLLFVLTMLVTAARAAPTTTQKNSAFSASAQPAVLSTSTPIVLLQWL